MKSTKAITKKALLVVLDGYGINPNTVKNAVKDASTPYLDKLFQSYPYTTITAGGELVGLPKGVPGNSEVGHMNLGAGRSIRQDLVRINEAIDEHTFATMDKLQELIRTAQKHTKRIHIIGLLSDGGVHSHIEHLKVIIDTFKHYPELKIFLHAFMDGRDTAKDSGEKYINELEAFSSKFTFASMQGRSIGMDRDRRWEKIKLAYDTFLGKGNIIEVTPSEYLKSEYAQGRFDEFITPVLFDKASAIEKDDCVFFINFRPDRAIQLTLAFNYPNFTEFQRPFIPPYFLCMTPYIPDEMNLPILFDKEKVPGGLSEYLSEKGLKQLKIAETEKYAHVTFFFNGGEKKPFENEEHILIPSPREVATYDLKPQMSAFEVKDKLIEKMKEGFNFGLVNFANSDMVGHTGNYLAAIKAVETLDLCVNEIVQYALANDYTVFITADHGNSDEMAYPDGSINTSHTGAPVPFCMVSKGFENQKFKVSDGEHALCDVAASILYSLDIDKPTIFTSKNIFN